MPDLSPWRQNRQDVEPRKLPKLASADEMVAAVAGRTTRRALHEVAAITRLIAQLGPDDPETLACMLHLRQRYVQAVALRLEQRVTGYHR